MSARPRKTPPKKRIFAVTSVLFSRVSPYPIGAVEKHLSDELDGARKAERDGEARHPAKRAAGTDWQSVLDLIVAAGKTSVLSKPTRSEAVREILAALPQTNEVKLASGTYHGAFLKWVRRQNM